MEGEPSQPPRPSWWSRNWKWVVPVICVVAVTAVVLPLLFIGALAYSVLSIVDHTFKSSGGYQQALAMVRADPAAMEALGTPIEDGWFPTGHVESGGSTGTSDLAIPVSGPNGGGTLSERDQRHGRVAVHAAGPQSEEHRGEDRPAADGPVARRTPRREAGPGRGLTLPPPAPPARVIPSG